MSEARRRCFTPGPWHLAGGRGKRGQLYVWSDRDERRKGYIGTHEICVAEVKPNGRCEGDAAYAEEEYEANARLIAAAPELLAVCVALVEDDDIAQGYGGLYAHLSKLRDLARAAIAKATGNPV